MNQPTAEATGERLPQPRQSSWSAMLARDSYVLLAGFLVLLALGWAAGMGLATALAIGALFAGWLSSWSP
jgi:hypothetical protein